MPRVSICIPTYNRASTLPKTINAILSQTFSDFELIISDDASRDVTEDVVRSFKDKRICYFRSEANLGLYPNWHRCIQLASTEYIAIYHDHDVYLPTIVERSVALLDRFPSASFVHTALLMINDQDTPVGIDIRSFPELMRGVEMARLLAGKWASPIMAATAMVRQQAYRRVGPYRHQQYGLGCDLDMWFRLSQVGDVAYVSEPQALIRVRRKGEETARFRWSDLVGSLHMRRDHVLETLDGDYARYLTGMIRYAMQRDIKLATFIIRAILLEPQELVAEGEAAIRREGSAWIALLAEIIKRSPALQTYLRRFIMPIHYRKVNKSLEFQRIEAAEYVKKNEHLLRATP